MDSLPTIVNRNDNLPNVTFNFNALREEGTAYIAQLGHKLWTDFNAHDPGITILEALCYAINDLGYRTSFPIQDILTCPNPAEEIKQFYTAKEILTCCPVTALDFRKIIIDVEGVKNAWLFKAGREEQAYYKSYYSIKEQEAISEIRRLTCKLHDYLESGESFEIFEDEAAFIELFKKLICEPGPYGELLFCFLANKYIVHPFKEDLEETRKVLAAAQTYFAGRPGPKSVKVVIVDALTAAGEEPESLVQQISLVVRLINSGTITDSNLPLFLALLDKILSDFGNSIAISNIELDKLLEDIGLNTAEEQAGAQSLTLTRRIEACMLRASIWDFIDLIWNIPFSPNDTAAEIRERIENAMDATQVNAHQENIELLLQKIPCGADLSFVKKKLKYLLDALADPNNQLLPNVIEKGLLSDKILEFDLAEYTEEVLCLIKQADLPGHQLIDPIEIKKVCDFFTALANTELVETFTENLFNTQLEDLIAVAIADGPLPDDDYADLIKLFLEKCICWRIVYCEEDELPDLPIGEEPEQHLLNGLYHIQLCLEDFINTEDDLLVNEIKQKVLTKLCQYRNLGEDFHSIDIIPEREVCLNVEIDGTDNADLSEIQAQIIYRIQTFLNPLLNFYSLEEMLDKGKSCEEIFQSTILDHGFLCDEEVENARLRRVIYKSDLYNIIMDIEGVEAIKSLQITLCNEDYIICGYNHEWCLDICQKEQFEADPWIENPDFTGSAQEKIKDRYQANIECYVKPRLSIEGSTFIFNKGNVCLDSNRQDVEEKLTLLHQIHRRPAVNDIRDIPVPRGTYRKMDTYYSIQEDFPLVYRVGKDQVPDSFTQKHKAQVKQLKAYLTFFDQILANYLAQLGHVKEILSVCPSPDDPGLYYKSLKGLDPGIDELFFRLHQVDDILITRLEGKISKEQLEQIRNLKNLPPLHRQAFIHTVQKSLGGQKIDREVEKLLLDASVVSQYYEDKLADITENELERFARRNQVLDHLIARFGEKFTDYVLSICSIEEEDACKADRIKVKDKLLACKTDFLKSIPVLGSHRGKGLNYKGDDCFKRDHFWYADNVAGLKKRVNKLLCLPKEGRTPLACMPGLEVAKKIDETRKCFQFVVVEKGQNPNHVNTKIFLTGLKENSLRAKGTKEEKQMERALVRANQPLKPGETSRFLEYDEDTKSIVLYNTRGRMLASSRPFDNPEQAHAFRALLIKHIFPDDCESEGFHIIEHILLRPTSKDVPSLDPIDITPGCKVKDAYSFWITVIASDSWSCFQEKNGARTFFEQLVRKETPAHIGICFLWIDGESMYRFEEAYQNWLYDLARQGSDECEIEESLSHLINLMNDLYDLYKREGTTEVCPEPISTEVEEVETPDENAP